MRTTRPWLKGEKEREFVLTSNRRRFVILSGRRMKPSYAANDRYLPTDRRVTASVGAKGWSETDRHGRKPRETSATKRDVRHLLVVVALFLGSIAWMVVFRSGAGAGGAGPSGGPGGTRRMATGVSGEQDSDFVGQRWDSSSEGRAREAARADATSTTSTATSTDTHTPRLLLLSHGRLMWFDLVTEEAEVVDSGHGVYYGGFVLGTDLYYVSRPHNWKVDPEAKEYLVNESTGARWALPSKFTHDVVAHGGRVYVADTGNGRIIEVDGARAIGDVLGAHELFTAREHVNTLAVDVTDPRYMWAMLHNLGPSMLAKVDMGVRPPRVVQRIPGVGKSSHGAVQYEVQGRYESKCFVWW